MNVPGWAATVVPAVCWLVYRILVLRHLSRALDRSPQHARALAAALRTATGQLSTATTRVPGSKPPASARAKRP